ncbi:MAG: sporulation protein YqfC [Sporolactobacillus sp.]
MERKLSRRLKKWFSEVAEIPEDITLGLPKLTVIGQSCLSVENYKSVLHFSNEELMLELEQGQLHISGENFVLDVILKQEIVLNGMVHTIEFVGR